MSDELKQTNVEPSRLYGRSIITTSETSVDARNVVPILEQAIKKHSVNAAEISELFDIYKGKQSILKKQKIYRPEINNIVVENHAYEIVSFKVGYAFGDPIQYTRRGAVTSETSDEAAAAEISKSIGDLNEYMAAENKAVVDKEVAECFHICGVGYKGILPDKRALLDEDESPFEIEALDPKTTFVVYSSRFGHRPLMGVQIITLDGEEEKLYAVYTDREYFEIRGNKILKWEHHSLGGIPIVEYPANSARMGAFEPVIGIMDALNQLASNRLDGITQHIQSILKFVNCETEDEAVEKLSELGAIMVSSIDPSKPADVDILTAELNQDQTQTLVEYLYQTMLTICGIPDRQGSNRTTGDTGAAVILRDGWGAAESMARDTELMFKKSEAQFLKVALRICEHSRGLNLRQSDIAIKFTRNRTDNLLVKTQGLLNMLRGGIHPQIAISHCGLFSDPEQVYLDSKETMVTPELLDKGVLTKTQINKHVDGT